jgi:hypothetical protein
MTPSLAEKIRSFDPTLPLAQAWTIPSSWHRMSRYTLERAEYERSPKMAAYISM